MPGPGHVLGGGFPARPQWTTRSGFITAAFFPASDDLVEGTGTRSHGAVTTEPRDWLVVEVIVENGTLPGSTMTPSVPGLTFTTQNDIVGAILTDDSRIYQFTAADPAGGSRTVTITAGAGGLRYRSRVTVVRNSDGPGTGKGTSSTAQTVSVARQRDNSTMFMTVSDWSAGAVGSPAWTPGGATVASQQGVGATYLFGRWDDSAVAATASHGITSPAYTTPSIAVLEMLGHLPAGAAAPAPMTIRRRGLPTYLRRSRTALTLPPQVVSAPAFVPPPVRARTRYVARKRTSSVGPLPAPAPAAPAFVPSNLHAKLRPALARRRSVTTPPPVQPGIVQAIRSRLRPPRLSRAARATSPPAQAQPPPVGRPRVRMPRLFRGWSSTPVPAQALTPPAYVPQPSRVRARIARPFRGGSATPVPPQIVVAAPTYLPQTYRQRVRAARLFRGHAATPVPAQATVAPPTYPPQALRLKARLLRLFRGRSATPAPPQVSVAVSVFVPQRGRVAAARMVQARRGRPIAAPPRQEPVPLLTRVKQRAGRLFRGKTRSVVPAQVVVVPPAYPLQAARNRRRFWFLRRKRTDGWLIGTAAHGCTTPRPGTGTTGYDATTTARPTAGMTAQSTGDTTPRPNSGTTEDPC